MVETLEHKSFSYRAPYSIQIKLYIKDTLIELPSNFDRVGGPSCCNIRGTTLELFASTARVIVRQQQRGEPRFYNIRATTLRLLPYDMAFDTPYDTASTTVVAASAGIRVDRMQPCRLTVPLIGRPYCRSHAPVIANQPYCWLIVPMSPREIVDAVLRLQSECRVADIWHSANTIAKI
jgi:hypothetical protein